MGNNKFSSYSFWIAVSGAVVIFLKNLLQVFGVSFDTTAFETIVVSLCGVLVVLGVLTKDKDEKTNLEENKNDNKVQTSETEEDLENNNEQD